MNIKEKFNSLSKKNKIIFCSVFAFLLIDILLLLVMFITGSRSSVKLEVYNLEKTTKLHGFNSAASNGFIKNEDFAFYKFSEAQKRYFEEVYNSEGTVSLTVRVDICPDRKQQNKIIPVDSLKFGYIYDKDLLKSNSVAKNFKYLQKIEVSGNENNHTGLLDISFALSKNQISQKEFPAGFYVYSSTSCKIISACIAPSVIGFDVSTDIPYYGFSCNGGIIDFTNTRFDFSGAALVMPVQSSALTVLPEYVVKFSENREYKSSLENVYKAYIRFGSEEISLKNVINSNEVIIPCGAVKTPFSNMVIYKNNELISSVLLRNVKKTDDSAVLTPIKTDPGLILNYNLEQWRTYDYELFVWDRYPSVLFFDTRDYEIQNEFFRRIAFFVEKEGYKGTLVSDEELKDKHGYNAHDYSGESLARFFNKAIDENFPLNKYELLLKDILLKNGLLTVEGKYVKGENGGIVSISRECPQWSRVNLLAHEGWHTLFFYDEDFRNYVSAVYYTCDSSSRDFMIDYFKSQPQLGYDINDDYLMHNEFMAYLLQQPLNKVGEYFVHCASRGTVMKFTPELSAYVRETRGQGFEDAAIALNDFIFDRYGIVCGNISLVSK